ncbi:MAG: hypothetical protein ACYDA4_05580 [Ignavibacteriaceae bacterium]
MGQQQLLLIVLGVIIVGIAIVVGINLFNANAVSSNRDAVISDLNNLAAMAQQYYMKPASMGGGANTYTGWTLPTGLSTTANGSYTITTNSGTSIVITGVGTQTGNGGTVTATCTVSPSNVVVAVVH